MNVRSHLLLGTGAGALYLVASLWLMIRHPHSPAALAVVLGPMTVFSLAGLWKKGTRVPALLAGALAATLATLALRGDGLQPQHLYLLQHAGIHLVLAAGFATTLRAGSTPLISQVAARLHRLTPAKIVYTRQLTVAWVVYFVAMAAASVLIFAWSYTAWTWFANLFTPAGVVLMFAGDLLARAWLHPEFERVTLAAAWRAYQDAGATPVAVPSGAGDAPQVTAREGVPAHPAKPEPVTVAGRPEP